MQSITLPMLQKKEMKNNDSQHQMMVVTTMLVEFGVTQPNPNIMHNTTHNNKVKAQTSKVVPVEIAQLLESNSLKQDSDDANLFQQILPEMVDDDNLPLPENIPTSAEAGQDAPPFSPPGNIQGAAITVLLEVSSTRHA